MSLVTLGALLSAWFAALASPGPDIFQIIRLGSRKRAASIRCALGIMAGNTLWILGSLFGLSALVNTYPDVLSVLKAVGGSYLIWLGIGAIRSGIAEARVKRAAVCQNTAVDTTSPADEAVSDNPWLQFRIGLATNLANPKALIFFGAVFAQFVMPGTSLAANALIALVLIVVGIAWFIGIALMVGVFTKRIAQYGHFIEWGTGVIFIVLGAILLVSGVFEVGFI